MLRGPDKLPRTVRDVTLAGEDRDRPNPFEMQKAAVSRACERAVSKVVGIERGVFRRSSS